MSKHDMMEQIRFYNDSASSEFLATFNEQQLESYLQRLTKVRNRRGRGSVWVRQGDTSAIVRRCPELH